MKLTRIVLMVLFVGTVLNAAQDTDITNREVRDPKKLETWLEANAGDAETRLTAAGAIATSAISLTNSSNAGSCSITSYADIGSDAGDMVRLLFGDGGGLAFQTDKASKGTLATKFTIGEAGRVTLVGSATLDNDTSADELNITETAVKVTGNFAATGTTTLNTSLTGVLKAASGVVSATAGYTGTNIIIEASNTNTITVIGGVITAWTRNGE